MARVVIDPLEYSGADASVVAAAGWTGTPRQSSSAPRKDVTGGGGNWHTFQYGTQTISSPLIPIATDHYFIKAGLRLFSTTAGVGFRARTGGGTAIFTLDRGSTSIGTWKVADSSGTLATSSVKPNEDVWYLVEAEVYHHPSAGFVKVWIDGVQIIDYSGAVADSDARYFEFGNIPNTFDEGYVDDIGVNTITLRYDGGTGTTPTAGATLTDGSTGSTAIIQGYEGDAASGVLTVAVPSGAFGDNNTITDGSGFSASVDAPTAAFVDGLEPNSGRLGNEYIVAIQPTGAGASTDLTPTGSGNNWENVDEIGPNTSDFNTAGTAGDQDTYTNNASSKIPAGADVSMVSSVAYAASSLTGIDGAQHLIRSSGGTDYSSERYDLGSSYAPNVYVWDARPDNSAGWTRTGIVTDFPQFGIKFVV